MEFAFAAYMVALPYLAMRDFNASSLQLGWLTSLRSAAYVVACMTLSRLADRRRRGRLIATAGVGLLAVFWLTAWAGTFAGLMLIGVLWGVSMSMFWPSIFAWLADAGHGASLGSRGGAVNLSWSLGGMLGALIAGALFAWNPALPFLLGGLPVILACAPYLFARDEHSHPRERSVARGPARIEGELVAAWIGNLSCTCLFGLLLGVFPRLAETMGVAAGEFGMLSALSALGRCAMFAVAFTGAAWVRRWPLMGAAQLVAAGMVATLSFASDHFWLAAVFLVVGVAGGLNYNRALYVSLRHPGGRGLKSGLHEATLVFGVLLGSLGGGWVVSVWGLRAPYVPVAVLTVALSAVQPALILLSRRREKTAGRSAG